MDIHKLLKELTETPGPSGFEMRAAEVVVDSWRPLADEVTIDRLGSVTASKAGFGRHTPFASVDSCSPG